MTTTTDQLERLKLWAQIASTVAVPVVLAIAAYFVQRAIAQEGLRKDYVQMSLAILEKEPGKENKELRSWAIAVLDQHSPVPIPAALKTQLASSSPGAFRVVEANDPLWLAIAAARRAPTCLDAPNEEFVQFLVRHYPSTYEACPNEPTKVRWKGYWDKGRWGGTAPMPPFPPASSPAPAASK